MSKFKLFYDDSPDDAAYKALNAANEALKSHGIRLQVIEDGSDSFIEHEILVEAKDKL